MEKFQLDEPPRSTDMWARARLTASCRDADLMPRTADAGEIVTDDKGRRVQVMHIGLRVLAGEYGGEWTSQLIEDLRGVHEPQEEAVFASLLGQIPESATVLEIGAYSPYYTLWFLSEAPEARRGVALEADPHNLSIGRQNCELNGL